VGVGTVAALEGLVRNQSKYVDHIRSSRTLIWTSTRIHLFLAIPTSFSVRGGHGLHKLDDVISQTFITPGAPSPFIPSTITKTRRLRSAQPLSVIEFIQESEGQRSLSLRKLRLGLRLCPPLPSHLRQPRRLCP
jgi:hypothetical protein